MRDGGDVLRDGVVEGGRVAVAWGVVHFAFVFVALPRGRLPGEVDR